MSCEFPPFTPDLGHLATPIVVSDNSRREEGKKQSANDTEEGSHLRGNGEEGVHLHTFYTFRGMQETNPCGRLDIGHELEGT